ncbi:MAG: hypothetical protein JNM51_10985 [Bacteroidia bacterium]|nr:hypothetical protein [Bacteroidia bacterium]
MRDVIWTVIIVWVLWKLYDAFKHISKTKKTSFNEPQREGEIKIDKNIRQKAHFNPNDAEEVDYEEIR